MRTLHILNHLTGRGNGIVNVAADLTCEKGAAGHDVIMVSDCRESASLVQSHGRRREKLNQSPNISNIARAAVHLRNILVLAKPDVIHTYIHICKVSNKEATWLHLSPFLQDLA